MIPEHIKILLDQPLKDEEAQAAIYILDLFSTCYPATCKAYERMLWSWAIYSGKGNYWHESVSLKESKKVLAWVQQQGYAYFEKKLSVFEEMSDKIDAFFESVQKHESCILDYAKNIIQKCMNFGQDMYGYSIITECLDVLHDEDYQKMFPGKKEVSTLVSWLSSPERVLFLGREKLNLISIAKKAKSPKNITKKEIQDLLQIHQKKYFWVQNSFFRAQILSTAYFEEHLTEIFEKGIAKEEKNVLASKDLHKKVTGISGEMKEFFRIVRLFSYIQDRRKENVMKLVYCVDKAVDCISQRLGIAKQELILYLPQELIHAIETKKKTDVSNRSTAVFFGKVEGRKVTKGYFWGTEAEEIILYIAKQKKVSSQLKGNVACTGGLKQIEGVVRIVFDPVHDMFNKGEILVTGMTRPEFVPLMKKAKAIVTNEGGITTHAAIVSRELNLPAIIGTKVATDVLKDGDTITLNMETGTITKKK